ncbi:hypothetical protein QQ020_07850 [Fulvivirgaceae bacterium BMA12]|uniref:HTH luxR-type domain-containing protein n=1 Tax=Agaribacillus aureus TaxID=3051825 RepID=A0ABT8L2G8_9BACT|nr:hypothetical protein [Fulvivirgaceae bacterium BMA12]
MGNGSNGSHKLSHFGDADFTDFEIKIIRMICKEYTTNQMANETGRSVRNINKYRQKLLVKTGSTSAIGILRYAIKHQIYEKD